MGIWRLLADGVVLFHAVYVGFVVFGLLAIPIGAALGLRWVRNFRFRMLHLAAIGLVFLEAMMGVACPLTLLENDLRLRGGELSHAGDFISYWTHRIIFYSWPPWVFEILYAGTMLAILALLLIIPPDFRTHRAAR
jgi:hypothetical protein